MDIRVSYGAMIVGSLVSIVLALALQFVVFSVDYSRTEHLQFEDDEYYYYVKAVPKVSVAVPEKTVKRINERQETTAIDADAVQTAMRQPKRKVRQKKEDLVAQQTDEMMLAKTLEDELDIQKIIEDEFKF